jgi:copper chaperone
METTYKVDGMTCGGCVASVTRALERVEGDLKIDVQLDGGKVKVEGEHSEAAIQQAVEDAGFDFVGKEA